MSVKRGFIRADQCDYCISTVGVVMRRGVDSRLFKSCPTCAPIGYGIDISSGKDTVITGQFKLIGEQSSLIGRHQERIAELEEIVKNLRTRVVELEATVESQKIEFVEREAKRISVLLQPKSYLSDSANSLGPSRMSELLSRRKPTPVSSSESVSSENSSIRSSMESMELSSSPDSLNENMERWISDEFGSAFVDRIIGEELDD